MSHVIERAELQSYFASMNPLASKIIDSLSSVQKQHQSSWGQMEQEAKDDLLEAAFVPLDVRNRYSRHWANDESNVQVFPKFIPAVTKKIIVDDNDGKTWEDEHSGQFSWETNSQLDLNLNDLDSVPTPAVPRKSQDSAVSATSPNGAKPTPVRKARLVENWLDSPVLKAMQENSSAGQLDGSDREAYSGKELPSEEPDLLKKFGITFSLNSGIMTSETSTDEAFTAERRPTPQKSSFKRQSSGRSPSRANDTTKSPAEASPINLLPSPMLPITASTIAAPPHQASIGSNIHDRNLLGVDDVSVSVRESRQTMDPERSEARAENMGRDEEKEEEKPTGENTMMTTITVTRTPVAECDDIEEEYFTTTTTTTDESVTAVKTGFDFLDNW